MTGFRNIVIHGYVALDPVYSSLSTSSNPSSNSSRSFARSDSLFYARTCGCRCPPPVPYQSSNVARDGKTPSEISISRAELGGHALPNCHGAGKRQYSQAPRPSPDEVNERLIQSLLGFLMSFL